MHGFGAWLPPHGPEHQAKHGRYHHQQQNDRVCQFAQQNQNTIVNAHSQQKRNTGNNHHGFAGLFQRPLRRRFLVTVGECADEKTGKHQNQERQTLQKGVGQRVDAGEDADEVQTAKKCDQETQIVDRQRNSAAAVFTAVNIIHGYHGGNGR